MSYTNNTCISYPKPRVRSYKVLREYKQIFLSFGSENILRWAYRRVQ